MAKKEIIKKVKIEVTDGGDLKRTKNRIDALNKAQQKGSKSSMEYNRNMKGLSKQSSNASKNFSKQAQGMQGVLVPAYAEIAARVFALSAAFNALSNAADFRILMQGQAEYAKRTGKNMAEIAKSVQRASKGMLGFKEASSAVALATTSGIGNQQIVKMTKAAVDSSTALGRSVSDTMDRLTRGIVKAEPEILDEIGVIIRLDKVYKDYAESVKKSTTELTEGEKASARYTAIMGQLEEKFGGIADAVDPNYFKATQAAVMDTIHLMSSGLVKALNPILKFLSESKQIIIVILAVVLKTLAGKIFPALGGMGKSIAEMPAKMDRGITRLDKRINRLSSSIATAKTRIKSAKSVLSKMVPEGQRGQAWTAVSSDRQIQRSVMAQTKWAESNIGKEGTKMAGRVAAGPWMGKTSAEVAAIKSQAKLMGKEMNKAHGIVQKFFIQGAKAGATMSRSLLKLRRGWAESRKQAMRYFNSTKMFIAHRGMIVGTGLALRKLGKAWREVNFQAGIFNAVTKTAKAGLSSLAVMAGIAGAVLSKLFSWVIILSVVASMSKMILGIWIDFDSKMTKATKAARQLKGELSKTFENLEERDEIINFHGVANSFDEAMANAQFASNFSEQFYDQVSAALKKINTDIENMSWWDKVWDKVKDLVGLGFADNLYKDVSLMGKIFEEAYGDYMPSVMDQLRKDLPDVFKSAAEIVVSTIDEGLLDSVSNGAYFEAITALKEAGIDASLAFVEVGKAKLNANMGDIMANIADAQAKGGNVDASGQAIGAAATATAAQLQKFGLVIPDLHDPSVRKTTKKGQELAVPKTFQQVMDRLNDLPDDTKKTQAFVDTMQHMSNIMETIHEKERKRLEDLRALSTAFDTLSKARSKFQESLLVKTGVHDMAVEQNKIKKMWEDTNISFVEKVSAAQKAGMLDRVYGSDYLKSKQDELAEKKKNTPKGKLTQSEWMEKVDPEGEITGRIRELQRSVFDMIGFEGGVDSIFKHKFIPMDKELMQATTKRLKLEEKINLLKFGKMAPGNMQALAKMQKQVAILNLKEAEKSLEVLKADPTSTYEQRNQAMVNYNIQLRKAQAVEQINLQMAESRAKVDAKKLTLEEKYAAIYQDRIENERAWEKEYSRENWKQWFTEKNTALTEYANNFALTIDKNIADAEKLRVVISNLNAAVYANAGKRTYQAMAFSWGKFLPEELLNPKNMEYLLDLATTSEGKQTLSKFKTVKLEIIKNELEMANLTMSKGQLAFRKKLAEVELNVANEQHKAAQKRLETELRISSLKKEIARLEREEAVRWAVDAMKEIADGFGSALKSSLTDVFMNKGFDMDKFRTGIAQSFASAGAGIISNTAQKAVFGNKGFLASMMRGTKMSGMVDDLFPKTQLEIARDDLAASENMLIELASIRQILAMDAGIPEFGRSQRGFEWFGNSKFNDRNSGYNVSGGVGSALTNILMGVITGRFAKGGIAAGGFRAFANGGIANRATLGMVGEGRYNEAVVPLPDGRSIPVTGAGNNVTVNVAIDSNGQAKATESTGSGAKELGYLISQAVQSELVDQQRPGGLLSSY
jgi:hypothetical protein